MTDQVDHNGIALLLVEHVRKTGHRYTWMYDFLNDEKTTVSDIERNLKEDDITSLEEAIFLMIDTPTA